jgi:hypothetical protein
LLVECDKRRLFSAGRADKLITIDQRRLGIGPLTKLAAEVVAQMLLPANVTGFRFHANEVAIRAKRVEKFAVDRRRRASTRIWRTLFRIADYANALSPNLFTVFHVQRLNELVVEPFVANQINAVIDDCRCGIAIAEVADLPQQRRPLGRPLLQQPGLFRNSVALRPAPLRPVGGQQSTKRHHPAKTQSDDLSRSGNPHALAPVCPGLNELTKPQV